jgi:hypothetical protein
LKTKPKGLEGNLGCPMCGTKFKLKHGLVQHLKDKTYALVIFVKGVGVFIKMNLPKISTTNVRNFVIHMMPHQLQIHQA